MTDRVEVNGGEIPPLNVQVSGYDGIFNVFSNFGSRFDYSISTSPLPKKEEEKEEEEDIPILPILGFLALVGGVLLVSRKS